jgi:iron complex outermembrane receptor protein
MTKLYLFVRRYVAVLLVFGTLVSFAQDRVVTGKVTSADDGSGVPGVNILEKGTANGTVSDAGGNFRINVGSGATLVFSFVGYQSQEVAVGSQSVINVALASDVTALSEVVVVGYGSVEKKDATGAMVSLKSENFNPGVISSPEQLIQGKAAGVQITSASGEPGAGVNIRIRGTSSVRNGNNPLFVVDGVPLAGDDISPQGSNQGLGTSAARNPLNFLNPNDIASIDILKDASATAIYGSRGANGVVLITTKGGKLGKPTLDYTFEISSSKISKKYDLLSPSEFVSAYADFNGTAAAATIDKGSETDWQDAVTRTGITQNHNISYGANDAGGDYRLSIGYMDQEGIVKKSDLKRFSTRFNGNKKFMNDKLNIGTMISVASTEDGNVPITQNSGFEGDLWGNALKANPTAPIYDSKGPGGFYQPSNVEPNPVALIELSKSYTNTIRALGSISAEYKIFKDLSFKTVYGYDASFSTRKSAFSRDLNATGIYNIGRLFLNEIQVQNNLWENYFTYDRKFDNISLNALLGYSYQSFSRGGSDMAFANFRTSDLDIMINNLASANQTPSGGQGGAIGVNSFQTNDELQSYYGRVNLGFADKYLFTATVRADGSTKFGPGNQYGVFPSAAIKWRVAEESFAPDLFSDLNVRVGYGITGNQEIPHNLYQERQRYGNWNLDNNKNITGGGLTTVAFPNPDLKWESTAQFNIGVDFGFFDNKIRGSLDYYNKDTQDLLIQVVSAQPAVTPFVWKNLDANVINSGLEISIEADAISRGDFKWTINGNVAFNNNEVKNFGGLINTGAINGQGLTGAFAQRIAQGQSLYAWFLRDFAGYDENGITVYNGGDFQQFFGKSPLPTTNMGLTNTFRYKNWDLNIFLSGQYGHWIYSNTANAFFTAGSLANGRNVTKDVVGNGEGKLNAPDVSTRFLEKGNFTRLQNLTLGYNVKTNSTIISSLRLYLNGNNLFVITDYSGQDPEVNINKSIDGIPSAGIDYTAYPRARTWTFGVKAAF